MTKYILMTNNKITESFLDELESKGEVIVKFPIRHRAFDNIELLNTVPHSYFNKSRVVETVKINTRTNIAVVSKVLTYEDIISMSNNVHFAIKVIRDIKRMGNDPEFMNTLYSEFPSVNRTSNVKYFRDKIKNMLIDKIIKNGRADDIKSIVIEFNKTVGIIHLDDVYSRLIKNISDREKLVNVIALFKNKKCIEPMIKAILNLKLTNETLYTILCNYKKMLGDSIYDRLLSISPDVLVEGITRYLQSGYTKNEIIDTEIDYLLEYDTVGKGLSIVSKFIHEPYVLNKITNRLIEIGNCQYLYNLLRNSDITQERMMTIKQAVYKLDLTGEIYSEVCKFINVMRGCMTV